MTGPLNLHASAVTLHGRGLLILGASGSGKSSLALDLIALGATLVSDDRTLVTPGRPPTLDAPDTIAGLIEARGIGLICMPHTSAPLSLIVDLDSSETDRLPQKRESVIAGHAVRTLPRVETPAFASMLAACLKGSFHAP